MNFCRSKIFHNKCFVVRLAMKAFSGHFLESNVTTPCVKTSSPHDESVISSKLLTVIRTYIYVHNVVSCGIHQVPLFEIDIVAGQRFLCVDGRILHLRYHMLCARETTS